MPQSRVAGWRDAHPRLIAFLCGAIFALGHAPFGLFPTFLIAVPVIALIVFGAHSIRRFWIGWFAGFGYFLVSLHWIVEPFLVDVEATGWMAPFALILLAGGLALFWAIAFWAVFRLPSGITQRLVMFPIAWATAELARSTMLTGFPWALPAYIWMDTPIAQSLAYIGPYGLSFATLQFGVLLTLVLHYRIAAPLGLVAVAVMAWLGLDTRPPPQTAFTETLVRLIQPNAQQQEKWKPEMAQVFWDRQLAMTAAEGEVDIVIWPEVAVPYLFDEQPQYNRAIAAQKPEATVIFGARHVDRQAENWYNSAVVLAPNGEVQAYYDKHHLVPFGEYLPFAPLWDRFGLRALAQHAGRFASGTGGLVGTLSGLPALVPLICYEMIFPDEVRRAALDKQVLIHVTNDAWFGNFSGPYQHLDQAKARAIETGLPVARSANTGVSAMIDPYGRLIADIPLNTEGWIDVAMPKALSLPFATIPHYARFAILAVAALILAGLAKLARLSRTSRNDRSIS